MIELEHVSKQFEGKRNVSALNDVHVAIGKGERVAIIGPSGSGKSTLLNLVGGLDRPTSGEVRVDGKPLSGLSDDDLTRVRRDTIGFVFQFFNLLPTLTVAENVELPLALNAVAAQEARRRSHALLQELGLGSCAGRFPEELSGGEQQRVAIARAVVHEPQLVLADEPTGNLDLETAGQVIDLLRRTCERRGTTLLIATHSTDVAAQATRVIAIRGGHIEEGPS